MEKKRYSFTRGNWEDEEEAAKVIRRSGQRKGKRARWVQGPGKQMKKLFQELFPFTMLNTPKKSSKMKTKN